MIRPPKEPLGEAADLLARRKASVDEWFRRVERAFHPGEELPPVSLYRAGYFVLDGHHRVSVTSYHGVERRDKGTLIESSNRGIEPRMQETIDLQLAKQHREETLREVESNRQAKALRAARERRTSRRRSDLEWEVKRHAGRLFKLVRALRNAG